MSIEQKPLMDIFMPKSSNQMTKNDLFYTAYNIKR